MLRGGSVHLGCSDSRWLLAPLVGLMVVVQLRRQLRVRVRDCDVSGVSYMRVDVRVGTADDEAREEHVPL